MTHTDLAACYDSTVLYRRALQLLAMLGYDECADYAGDLDELAAVVWKAKREIGCDELCANLSFEKSEVVSWVSIPQKDSAESRTFV